MIDETRCGLCVGGSTPCDDCDGAGWDPSHSSDYPWCESCDGLGRVVCPFCAELDGLPSDEAGGDDAGGEP